MNRRELIVGAGAVAVASALPAPEIVETSFVEITEFFPQTWTVLVTFEGNGIIRTKWLDLEEQPQ